MAKKKKGGGIRKAIKAAGPNISRSEMKSITKAAGGNVQKALNQISKADANLASGAANMLIKQQQQSPFAFGRSGLGDSKIAQALRQMSGTPDFRSAQMRQRGLGPDATPGTGMMIGGTVIRPGGRVAVKKQPIGAAPAVGDTTAAATAGDGTTATAGDGTTAATGGDAFDFQSMLDALTAMQQPAFDMTGLEDMFQTQFDQLSSQFDQMKPLRLAQLGRAYGADAIRARQNIRKTRQDYRRGVPAMALGNILANLAIGGGVTI